MKISLLHGKDLWKLLYWALFKPYKIMVMKHWEDKGMIDKFAMRKAEETTKEQYLAEVEKTKKSKVIN